ncbi:TetR/AcrR family transcriptional regulator [Siccirubricoccus sp. KC 17139]|uniref:TetR/AcrR family transcriptional regulator n=1 Tax=Siccirubricoccus soli TaxID=2899147 RepID=A0ABT1D641_9PROT|nr:TetR/AcrR family transcriptional regulator [Siccirubricoccus soli]MCP2683528.1 TetR/AcrR family transcriptional regulator [Siccirubricoccus soli]
MAEPQQNEGRDTRRLIVERAAEQFALWGYAGASISDIAAAVGVSKPALYYHFSDKEEIYTEIVTSVLSQMRARAEAAVAAQPDAPAKLRAFMRVHAQYLHENEHAYIAAQLGFRGLRATEGRGRALELRDRYEAVLKGIIAEGCRSGVFRLTDQRAAVMLVLSALNWMARWYRSDGETPAAEFADRYCNMLLDGFRPRDPPRPARRKRTI